MLYFEREACQYRLGPFTFKSIEAARLFQRVKSAHDIVLAFLVHDEHIDGIKSMTNEMGANDSQYGRFRLMLCGLDRIEDMIFRITPEIQKHPEQAVRTAICPSPCLTVEVLFLCVGNGVGNQNHPHSGWFAQAL